ncbi:MAG: 50S ribosomal protein L25/general stress protein Ctc [Pseudomonadota bacterium]
MAETMVLEAEARPGTGKGAARQARRDGMVPGVIYGGGKDPESINIKFNVLLKELKAGKFLSKLIKLKIGDQETTVICRAVQRDIRRDLPSHVDFLRLSEKSRINLFIPVEFEGREICPAIKRGGILTIVRPEVELKVNASAIPEKLTADLSTREIGDTIKISDIALPAGTRPMITDRDFVIANLEAPRGLIGGDDDADEGEAPAEASEATS